MNIAQLSLISFPTEISGCDILLTSVQEMKRREKESPVFVDNQPFQVFHLLSIMNNMITKKQKQVLDFIATYQQRKSYAPSLDDIRKRFKLASVSTAHFHVSRLHEMGYLIKEEHKPRAIDAMISGFLQKGAVTSSQPMIYKEPEGKKSLPLNTIVCGDAVEIMSHFPSCSVDMVVTSPPYDAVRDYKGFAFDLHAAGQEIHRVLKDGGVAAMVIQDQTKNFGKSLTSFRTIVDWCDSFGFKLFETVIYRKYGAEGGWWNKRFRVDHEYIPIFLKGERPQHFEKEHLKIPSKHAGKTMTGGGTRLTNGVRIATRPITINPTKCRGTIWEYLTAGDGTRLKHQHPATFPNQLPYDFIQCFCPLDGVVLDPFVGSGTTTVAAKNLGRKYIGIDLAPEYCSIAERRMKEECQIQKKLL